MTANTRKSYEFPPFVPCSRAAEYGLPYSDQYRRKLEEAGKFPRRRRVGPSCLGYSGRELAAFFDALPREPLPGEPTTLARKRPALTGAELRRRGEDR